MNDPTKHSVFAGFYRSEKVFEPAGHWLDRTGSNILDRLQLWNGVPRSREPGPGCEVENLKPVWFPGTGTREPIVTCLKIKEKIYLNIPLCSKARRNKLLSEFPFPEFPFPGNGDPDTPTLNLNLKLFED